jgi:hypothetical protein
MLDIDLFSNHSMKARQSGLPVVQHTVGVVTARQLFLYSSHIAAKDAASHKQVYIHVQKHQGCRIGSLK